MANIFVDESFVMGAQTQGLQELARCGECHARSALEPEALCLTNEEAASIQWARCAQCRSGIATWHRHR